MVKPLLLLIEDDETVCLSLKVFFEGRGYGLLLLMRGGKGFGGVFFEHHGGNIFCDDIYSAGCFLPVDIKDCRLFPLENQVRENAEEQDDAEEKYPKNFVLRLFMLPTPK